MTDVAPPARRPGWTLRRRLVFGIVALLAAISIIVGTVSVIALQTSLMARLDAQVTAATSRTQGVIDNPGQRPDVPRPDGGRGPAFLQFNGLPPRSLGAILRGGSVTAAILSEDLELQDLTSTQESLLLDVPSDGTPYTIDLGGSLGEYRVAFGGTRDGDGLIVGIPLSDVKATVAQSIIVIALVTLGGLAAAFFAGMAIVRLALRPLDRVAATASHVSELELDRGDVAIAVRVPDEDSDPNTEVGQVGAAINRMLGHVASALTARELSEKKLRTFVADASHELRTPLASIRGYAELTRRGGHDLPDDVVYAIGRVESESVRMTSLVEDLLLLARLDDGRLLDSKPVDLTRILTDVVSDAHAASQQHEWVLDLPDEPTIVPGDAARLHQVVANLLANARVHTPAGTRVVVSVREDAASGRIELAVADNGPGIDPGVKSSVFERFARGDGSRSRAAGSTGLGLAIVAAVVEAHHGYVRVESEPGSTVFTVSLPSSGVGFAPTPTVP